MTRILVLAAAALLPAAVPAAAETIHDTHVSDGAVAGRSPHRVLRPVNAAGQACGRPAMHSVPAGKGHVFGRHALAGEPCSAAETASAEREPRDGARE